MVSLILSATPTGHTRQRREKPAARARDIDRDLDEDRHRNALRRSGQLQAPLALMVRIGVRSQSRARLDYYLSLPGQTLVIIGQHVDKSRNFAARAVAIEHSRRGSCSRAISDEAQFTSATDKDLNIILMMVHVRQDLRAENDVPRGAESATQSTYALVGKYSNRKPQCSSSQLCRSTTRTPCASAEARGQSEDPLNSTSPPNALAFKILDPAL